MKRTLMSLTLALLMTLSLGGCMLFPAEEEALAPPIIEPKEITYLTEKVQRGDIQIDISVGATFQTATFSDVYYMSNGHVKQVHVRYGQLVKAGDLLIEMENESLEKQIRDQKLRTQRAEVALAKARKGNNKSDELIAKESQDKYDRYMERVRDQELNIRKAEIELFRAMNGESSFDVTQKQLDLTRARETMDNIHNEFNRDVEIDDEKDTYDIQLAKIDLEMARNSLRDLEIEYERNLVIAPIDGMITWIKDLKAGDFIQPYVDLVRVADPTILQLQYLGDKAKDFPVGMDITVRYKNKAYEGKVLSNPSTMPLTEDNKVQNIAIFSIEGVDWDHISMGETATVAGVLDRREDVIVLEKNRVNNYWGRQYVNLLIDGVKVERDVELGLQTSTKVEIRKGLEVDEEVIIR